MWWWVSKRRKRRGRSPLTVAITAAALILTVGCAFLESRPIPPSLRGLSKQEAMDHLGAPSYDLVAADGSESYLIYWERGSTWTETTLTSSLRGWYSYSKTEIECTMLVFRNDALPVRYRWGQYHVQVGAPYPIDRQFCLGDDFLGRYFSPEQIEEFTDRTEETRATLAKVEETRSPSGAGRTGNEAELAYQRWLTAEGKEQLAEAWPLLCEAANGGRALARMKIGYWHRTDVWSELGSRPSQYRELYGEDPRQQLKKTGVRPDDSIAYMWYTLAARSSDEIRDARDVIFESVLDTKQIAQAEQMARDWKPGDCPSAEHRLGVPGDK